MGIGRIEGSIRTSSALMFTARAPVPLVLVRVASSGCESFSSFEAFKDGLFVSQIEFDLTKSSYLVEFLVARLGRVSPPVPGV